MARFWPVSLLNGLPVKHSIGSFMEVANGL